MCLKSGIERVKLTSKLCKKLAEEGSAFALQKIWFEFTANPRKLQRKEKTMSHSQSFLL